jgi:hypothetical protein
MGRENLKEEAEFFLQNVMALTAFSPQGYIHNILESGIIGIAIAIGSNLHKFIYIII